MSGRSGWEGLLFFNVLLTSSPTDGRCVDTRCAHMFGVLQPELLNDELGVPEIGFQLKAVVGASYDTVEHFALGCLVFLVLGFASSYSVCDLISYFFARTSSNQSRSAPAPALQ